MYFLLCLEGKTRETSAPGTYAEKDCTRSPSPSSLRVGEVHGRAAGAHRAQGAFSCAGSPRAGGGPGPGESGGSEHLEQWLPQGLIP